ncbi:MAG: sodium:solute symporter [Paludibacteraceae bacterium]|nr:sodium:solute symporter [Paludibacteraceae bacterium]
MYLTILLIYVAILLGVGYLTSRNGASNEAFFSGNHRSPWYLVAFGMIGASISGISVVSIPGMVIASEWTYLQTCLGFFFGYVAVAYILLPLYYKLKLTSIYEYLNSRFGSSSYHTGSMFFVIAKMVSSATKLYIAVLVLQHFIFDKWNIPFGITVIICVAIIWLYTHRAGIRTIVWTDTLQTLFFIVAISIMCYEAWQLADVCLSTFNFRRLTFNFEDWHSTQYFWKQFISGIFIVIVMTGLDQDMMQKNLTCRTLRESQKNMLSYGVAFLPINFILLLLGSLIIVYAQNYGITLPDAPDKIMPFMVSNVMSPIVGICFVLGIISASFSSADSALTSITTTLAVDIFGWKNNEKQRRMLHIGVCVLFAIIVILFGYTQNRSIIDTIYTIVGYAYGPLLGMFAFGLFTRYQVRDKLVPLVAIASPIICYIINLISTNYYNYQWGYELLLLNGTITFVGLFIIRNKQHTNH